MKRTILVILFVYFTCNLFAQNVPASNTGKVIYPSSFRITLPLRDLVKLYPVKKDKDNEVRESPDRLNRPPQKFIYSAADGPQYGEDPSVRQTKMGTRHIGTKSLMANWPGQYSTQFRPFDPTGAAGPNHYVQLVNATNFKVFDKSTGSNLLTADLASLWSPATSDDGDPILMYDKFADRWFLSQFGQTGNYVYIAISTTNDPTGSYYTYSFASPQFPDYEKFSIWENGYYMTSNQSTDKVFCFERDQMILGNPQARSVYQTFTTGSVSGFFIPLPADASEASSLPDAGTPFPFVAYYDNGWGGGNDGINIWNMTVTWGATPVATISNATLVNTSAFDASYDSNWNDVTQPGTSQKLDGIGGVLMFRVQWTKWTGYNSMVMNWAVKLSSTQRSIRWCELRQDQSTGTWSLYQEGTYAPDSDTRWMGSIAMDMNGSIALAYCKSSSTIYPTLCFTGRLASDPLGVMTFGETVVATGASSQTSSNRDGDYSHTSLDPDGVTFWHTGEYFPSEGVRTRIFSFQLPIGNIAPTANFSANPTTTTCTSDVQFSDMSANTPTTWYWEFGDGQTSNQQSPLHTYPASGTYSVTLTCTNAYGSDTLVKPNYITINIPDNPGITDGYGCLSEAVVLTASGSGELHWFNAATGGTDLGTGTTYTTPVLTSDTTYYVENHIVQPSQYVGILNTSSSYSNGIYALVFDCYTPVTLVSVKVNKQTAGNAVFRMINPSGTVIYTDSVTLPQGESTVTLNWNVPVGSGFKLASTSGGFGRNNSGVSFPYTLSGFLSITSSYYNNANNTGRYGPFYDWQIKVPDCISARVPITAHVVTSVVPSVSLTASSTTICSGAQVSFTAAPVYGGQTPFYQWYVNGSQVVNTSNVFSSSQITNGSSVYCVMTSVLSCASPATATSNPVTITVDSIIIPSVSISVPENSICAGTNISFTATSVNGGTSPVYAWYINGNHVGNNTAVFSSNTLANGNTVSCVLTSSEACVSGPVTSNTENIVVHPLPPTPTISLNVDTLFSSAASGNQWYFLTAGIPVSGATNQIFIPGMNGEYFVIVTDSYGCVSDSSNIINVILTGISNPDNQSGFIVYPNPNHGDFIIYLPGGGLTGTLQYRIINALGQTLVQKDIKNNPVKVSTQSLINGIYYIEIIGMKENNVRKLIIQK
ncbi:MAG: PKD domain-containing protein [Bacteroidia bacterium]|nr:PKD domain-containing protein [Bacteroidia bacterium]